MSKEWYTAKELACFPGLPNTDRNIRIRASKEGWSERKKAFGKGKEYHISSLPSETVNYLTSQSIQDSEGVIAAKQLAVELEQIDHNHQRRLQHVGTKGLIEFNALPKKQQDLIMAKIHIIHAREEFVKPFADAGCLTKGNKEFSARYMDKSLDLPKSIYDAINRASKTTIDRWQVTYKSHGLAALGRRAQERRGDSVIAQQTELEHFCIALLIAKPHFETKPKKLKEYAEIQAKKLGKDWTIPSTSSFGRWAQQWINLNKSKWVFATDHKNYYGKERGLIHDHEPWVSAPNDMWELDSTPTDVMLRVNDKLVRYSIVGCIDVFTKRVKLVLSPTSTSEAISLLLRKVILDWGMLNNKGLIRTDNGSDYVAKKTVAIFDKLGVTQSRAEPFSGWQKPYIERFFGTFQGGVIEVMPTYIGHCVSDREKIEACHAFADRIGAGRKKRFEDALELAMTPSEMQQFMDDWIEYYYNHRAHSGNDGATPLERYQESAYRPQIIHNPRALDILLHFSGKAYVRRGGIQLNKLIYRAPELQEDRWNRQAVNVFLDPTDVAKAYIYLIDDYQTCVEAVNAELIGRDISPSEYTAARRKTEKELRQFKRDMKRYSEEFGIDELGAEMIAQAKAQNNVALFPKDTDEHDNPTLKALEKAGLKPPQGYSKAELDAFEQTREKKRKDQESKAEQTSNILKSEQEIAWDIAERIIQKEPITEHQKTWLKSYTTSHVLIGRRIQKYIESGGQTKRLVI